MKNISFTAAGDMLVQRRLPGRYEGFDELSEFIKKGTGRYYNLETTLNHGEGWGNQYGGGSWLKADPHVLEDARQYGFNMLSFANNHSLDFSHWGLLETIKALEDFGIPHAGCGRNMSEAAAPVYLDTVEGRIALIGATSTLENPSMAGEQSRRFIGRPGVNGIRHNETYIITKEQMDIVKQIAEETHINGFHDIMRAEGYEPALPENTCNLLDVNFKLGDKTKRISTVERKDMARVEKSIFEAQFQADYIIIAIHSHEVQGTAKETPDDFLVEFAHRCIDVGAHAIIGTGPHLLRPIEIYKGCPIFYSLGDFMLENENIPYGPEDFYEMYNLTSGATMRELFATRSNGFTRGLQTDHRMFESVIPYWETTDGRLTKMTLMPIELGFNSARSGSGLPRPLKYAAFIDRLADMSKPYGTTIKRTADGLAEIVL